MDSIWLLEREWDPQEEHNTYLQYYKSSVSSDGRLFVDQLEPPHTDNPKPETPHYIDLEYELHQGTKPYDLFFESPKMLEGSEIQVLKNLCEQERTQTLTILIYFNGKPTSSWLYAN